jgi:hypothetical protein
MTKRLIPASALGLVLAGAAPALAGPGSLPSHLLPPQHAARGDQPYALTGTPYGEETVVRARVDWIGGARDRRTVFDRIRVIRGY